MRTKNAFISSYFNGKKIYYMIGLFVVLLMPGVCGCGAKNNNVPDTGDTGALTIDFSVAESTGELERLYATEYRVDCYDKGLRLITIADDRYLVVPEGIEVKNVDESITILRQPLDNVYLASSSAMDLICTIGATNSLGLTGTKKDDWYVEEAADAMEQNKLVYAGKYNAPDYELILEKGCKLTIENTMIYHNPEVKEKLEELGIPVLVERSSYESEPMGRLEWIKLYGVLFGKEDEAKAYFDQVIASMSDILEQENTGKTVAYFYITGSGAVNVRKSKDYVARLIEMAGGRYIFEHLGEDEDNALSTVNMQQEEFYAGAVDADILIYNSTIAGTLDGLDNLLELCPMLEDFKAVREGNVYCTNNNFFQKTCSMGKFAIEVNAILHGTAEDNMEFLYKLK